MICESEDDCKTPMWCRGKAECLDAKRPVDRRVMCVGDDGARAYLRMLEAASNSAHEVMVVDRKHLGQPAVEPLMLRLYSWEPPEPPAVIKDKRPYWRRFEKYRRT